MKLSTDRILTTHTGSLPRAEDLTATLEALDSGRMPDPAAFDTRVREQPSCSPRVFTADGVGAAQGFDRAR